jgi:DNA-binding MarR family transcriptional regulator
VAETSEWDAIAHRELMILDMIEASPELNQRQISHKTSMALGMVNLYLNRLIRKGLVKIQAVPPRRYLYYLTPRGLSEKTLLTYEYMRYSFQFYNDARGRCRRLFGTLAEEKVARIGFLGKSDLAEIAYLTLQEYPIEFAGLFDDRFCGETFFGHRVKPLDALGRGDRACDRLLYTHLKPPAEGKKAFEGIAYTTIY